MAIGEASKELVEEGVELSRVICDDERLLHARQRTTRRVATCSRQFRLVGQQLGSSFVGGNPVSASKRPTLIVAAAIVAA